MKRVGIIDIGTNTFKLLIADLFDNKTSKEVCTYIFAVKMAEGGISKGLLSDAVIQRGLNALKIFRAVLDFYEVKDENVRAYGTSGLRTTSNGSSFLQQVKETTKIDVEIISGDKEAEWIYKAVKTGVEIGTEPELIMDIGGGSTEFIIANKTTALWAHSFKLGAGRLLELFPHNNPITSQQVEEIRNYISAELEPLKEQLKKYTVTRLIGCSGSFSSFSHIIAKIPYVEGGSFPQTTYNFTRQEIDQVNGFLQKTTLQERYDLAELNNARADLIVISGILTKLVLELTGIDKITYSSFSMRHGILQDLF